MTPDETKQAAQVTTAWAEGKKIERQSRSEGTWADCPQPKWNWYARDYRIAPAPTEVEVWVNADGSIRQKSWFEFSEPGKDWTLRRATIHAENAPAEPQ